MLKMFFFFPILVFYFELTLTGYAVSVVGHENEQCVIRGAALLEMLEKFFQITVVVFAHGQVVMGL
jgi:hypothetical protein